MAIPIGHNTYLFSTRMSKTSCQVKNEKAEKTKICVNVL